MGGSGSKDTIQGNTEAPRGVMMIEYCGGWGYWSYCKQLMNDIEKAVPNMYEYHCISDDGVTGRFEVTIFRSVDDFNNRKNGQQIYSKAKSGSLPFSSKNYDQIKQTI